MFKEFVQKIAIISYPSLALFPHWHVSSSQKHPYGKPTPANLLKHETWLGPSHRKLLGQCMLWSQRSHEPVMMTANHISVWWKMRIQSLFRIGYVMMLRLQISANQSDSFIHAEALNLVALWANILNMHTFFLLFFVLADTRKTVCFNASH